MSTPDYSKYLKKSFELTKKNKWLWVFAALVGSGGGFSGGLNFSKLFKDNNKPDTDALKNIPFDTEKVLGDKISYVQEWIHSVPTYKFVLLIILIILLVLTALTIVLIIASWGKGSLIKGIDMANSGEEVNLKNVSPFGFKYLKPMIQFSLLIMLAIFVTAIAIPFMWALIFLLFFGIGFLKIVWIILGIILIPVIALVLIFLSTLVNLYGERLIVLEELHAVEAFNKAVYLGKHSLFPALLMGIVNKTIDYLIGLASMILFFITVFLPLYIPIRLFETNPSFSAFLSLVIIIAFFIFLFVSMVFKASLTVFYYSNWNQLFNDVIDNTKKND